MRIENSIHIAAPIENVWSVTQDVEKWPAWTPTVTSVRLVSGGGVHAGAVARIKQPMQPESEWVVTEFVPGKRFAWETRRAGMRMVGTHDLSEENGGTRNILRVDATGALAVLLWPLLRVAVTKALADENSGLKQQCEAAPTVEQSQ